jgi:hypothetical protein
MFVSSPSYDYTQILHQNKVTVNEGRARNFGGDYWSIVKSLAPNLTYENVDTDRAFLL